MTRNRNENGQLNSNILETKPRKLSKSARKHNFLLLRYTYNGSASISNALTRHGLHLRITIKYKSVGSVLYQKTDKSPYLKGFLDLNILSYSKIIRELTRVAMP